ncbi:MAG: ATP-binding protein [Desulfosoma sp.]
MDQDHGPSAARQAEVKADLWRHILLEVFRRSPYGIGVLDARGKILEANDVLASWFSKGGAKSEELDAEALFQKRGILPRLLLEAQGQPCVRDGELTAVDGQGRTFPVSVTISRINLPEGHSPCFLLIVEDISEKKTFSQQLIRTEKLASLGTMAGGVAHDFNNILMTILGNTQLLSKELAQTAPHIRRRLKNIEQAVLDGAHVVRRLQVFTGKGGGPHEGAEKTVIGEAVQDVLELTRPRWKNALEKQGRRLEIVKELAPGICAAINGSDFREVLTNLVFNAIDAMPSGGMLRFRSYAGVDHVFLEVTDTGIGMDEETRKKIFDPFFTTKGAGNSGLGLSVCSSLIQRWGGHLTVQSVPGKGTTFTLRLPAAGTPERGRDTAEVAASRHARKRLLVVDDDREVLELLGDMLRLMGHQVTTEHDGRKALELLNTQAFDLILTDLGMPEVNGWDIAERAKERRPGVPVVMVSGWGAQYEDEDLSHRGVDLVCSKPLSYQKLLEILERFSN